MYVVHALFSPEAIDYMQRSNLRTCNILYSSSTRDGLSHAANSNRCILRAIFRGPLDANMLVIWRKQRSPCEFGRQGPRERMFAEQGKQRATAGRARRFLLSAISFSVLSHCLGSDCQDPADG